MQLSRSIWHILTSEYPPDPGGVSDYTRSVALGLSESGAKVHVWTHGLEDDCSKESIEIHRCLGNFEVANFARLQSALQIDRSESKLLVQYVPHGFGRRAMNVPLTRWIAKQSQIGVDVRLMLHEVAFPFVQWPIHHNLIALANRWMLRCLMSNPKRVYLSTPAWKPLIDRYAKRPQNSVWVPVPSNIPSEPRSESETLRRSWKSGDSTAVNIGHFGTFGGEIRRLALETFARLSKNDSRLRIILIGRGTESAKQELVERCPGLTADRIYSLENGDHETVSVWLQACDLMLQPYPDGISTRRGSAMACFANRAPVVSNLGVLSEDLWRTELTEGFANEPNVDRLVSTAIKFIESPSMRSQAAAAGKRLYDQKFAVENTIRVLLQDE
jgi:glycosyltransferase involved in cell wall biosynthesis